MDITQISLIAIVATILAVTVKEQKPEFSILISIVTGLIIFAVLSSYLHSIILVLNDISNGINLDLSFIGIIFKIVSIAYISEFSSHVCKDAGENAIAAKVELAGKVLILFSSAPIILSLLEMLSELV